MKQSQRLTPNQSRTDYWMRSVWFAGLHRILKTVAGFPHGLRARELNQLVTENKLLRTRRGSTPAPTTLYHYRNTLLRLGALKRNGRMLYVNVDDPDVYELLNQPTPQTADQSLCVEAINSFAELVLRNLQCRSLFFDLFLPQDTGPTSVAAFRQSGSSVNWTRHDSVGAKHVMFRNETTGRTATCTSPASIAAVLYGLRYWARDELKLIDEYSQRSSHSTVMFPVSLSAATGPDVDSAVLQTVRSHSLATRLWRLDIIGGLRAYRSVLRRTQITHTAYFFAPSTGCFANGRTTQYPSRPLVPLATLTDNFRATRYSCICEGFTRC